jgi:hypothetical protein
MDMAALLVMIAGAGVGTGWQPLPDGTPRSEFIVQIEPELLRSLAQSPSIPIVVKVPEDIGPIARVRLVAGRATLPRERIQVRAKPVTPSATSDPNGVVLTQYAESAAPRYGDAAAAASQAAGAGVAETYDPYTQVDPRTSGSWNAAENPPNPLRTAAAPTDAAPPTSWNEDGIPPAGGPATPRPLQRLGAEVQEAAQPLQNGIDQLSDRVRTAADNLNNRTGRLIDELGDRVGLPRQGGLGQAASPASIDAANSAAPAWNGGDAAPPATVANEADGPPMSWNNTPEYSLPRGSDRTGNATATTAPVAPPLATDPTGDPRYASAQVPDAWANAQDPRLRTGAATDATVEPNQTWPGAGPAIPPLAQPDSRDTGGRGAGSLDEAPGVGQPASTGTADAPAVRSGMFDLPANRALEGVDSPIPAAAPTGAESAFPVANQAASPASEGWDIKSQTPASQPPVQSPAAPSDARHRAAVILAWVLLSGSTAGNIYLFWSYLDVRTKYRALVRKTARAVGGRFSPA